MTPATAEQSGETGINAGQGLAFSVADATSAQQRHPAPQRKASDGRRSCQQSSGPNPAEHEHHGKGQGVAVNQSVPTEFIITSQPPAATSRAPISTNRPYGSSATAYYSVAEAESRVLSSSKKKLSAPEQGQLGQYGQAPNSFQNAEQYRSIYRPSGSLGTAQYSSTDAESQIIASSRKKLPTAEQEQHGQTPNSFQSIEQYRSLRRQNSKLQEELKRFKRDNSDLQRELGSLQSQLDNVQRIVSTADKSADYDVSENLKELNAEVFQTSQALVDMIERSARPNVTVAHGEPLPSSQEHIVQSIGPDLLNYLKMAKGDEDHIWFLAVAFRAYLSNRLCRIASLWTDEQLFNRKIEDTYERLREAEAQAMSGHWRSLTLTYISPLWVKDPTDLIQTTVAGLCDIAVMAGYAASRSAAAQLFYKFEKEHLLSIVSLARNLREKIAGVVSGDFEVLVVNPGDEFKEADMRLISGEPYPIGAADTVLCVSQVGLTKRMPGETKGKTMVKVEVVLKSSLILPPGSFNNA